MTTKNGTSADRFVRHATFTIERHHAFSREFVSGNLDAGLQRSA